MYAFRKPFTAATYEDVAGWEYGVDFKIAAILAQAIGYAFSKFIGIRLIAEMRPSHRSGAILGLVFASWLALLGFAVLPAPYKVGAMLLNGLPLGLIWGLVFSYVEGRRTSELLGALLCASFILSTGVVRSVGMWLMASWQVPDLWMPAATGAAFLPLLAVSVWGLSRVPPPGLLDELERTRRGPMSREARRAFLRQHAPALIALVAAYVLFTAMRDFRDSFSAEIWAATGYAKDSLVFTASEAPVALLTLAALGLIMLVRDNRRALLVIHAVVGVGALLIGLSTAAFSMGLLSPMAWMVLSGTGLYLGYAPFNAMLFDRLIAATRQVGTAGFLIYVADAAGYLATVALLLVRNFAAPQIAWLDFYMNSAYVTSICGVLLTLVAALHFRAR